MSSYLSFRKNGVFLTDYSRNTHIYEAFYDQAPYDKWGTVTYEDLLRGLNELFDEKKGYEKAIKRQKTALQYLKDEEAIYEAISSIQGMEEMIEELVDAIAEVRLLMRICNELSWDVDIDKDKSDDDLEESDGEGRSVFEWRVG